MNQVRLRNFRCFRDEQAARLAPLTLLVGENSTGKTSFLALIRALWDMHLVRAAPSFKEAPYDLGSFDEIVYNAGRRTATAESIEVGFAFGVGDTAHQFDAVIGRQAGFPKVVSWRLAQSDVWVEERWEGITSRSIRFGTANGTWRWSLPPLLDYVGSVLGAQVRSLHQSYSSQAFADFVPELGSASLADEDRDQFGQLLGMFDSDYVTYGGPGPFAGAPVRSSPRRTYDPAPPVRDPEGQHIPMYLASMFFENKEAWELLKIALEEFGREAGIFDEVSVRRLGKKGSEPFQMHVRRFGRRTKGPMRNLIDVGYGVSQVLPVISELFRDRDTPMFLLQQPEVHLHPSAQAALGSLFCAIATRSRQLVVETHSDHLLDRVRMDVRDGKSQLKPEDVSILYFERDDLDVRIHSCT